MRVVFLTPSVRPLGARRSLVELIRHLPGDVSPFVICPAEDGIYLELKELGVPVEVAPQGAWRKLKGRVTAMTRQIPRIRRILGSFSPDLLHANEFHIVPQAFYGSRRKYPLCGHVRLSIRPKDVPNYHMDACRRIVAVSEAVRGLFPDSLRERVRVVYNGVDVSRMTGEGPLHEAAAPWRKEPADTRPLVVGLFGLVSERKNQLVAAEAVARANDRGARVRLLIAGDAFRGSVAYGDRLRERLGREDLRKAAVWLPFQEDPAMLFRCIDINLLVSSEEGFGRTVIEAGAMGKPSIGARTGGIPELIDEGRTGWLTDAGDVEGLADLLVEVSRQRGEIHARGEAMRQEVGERFTIQAHVDAMIGVWRECLEG